MSTIFNELYAIAYRYKMPIAGQKKTCKKALKELANWLNMETANRKTNIKINSLFFNLDENTLHLYCIAQGSQQVEIRVKREDKRIVWWSSTPLAPLYFQFLKQKLFMVSIPSNPDGIDICGKIRRSLAALTAMGIKKE